MKNWIIVANKAEAKVFSVDNTHHDLTELTVLHNESGRLKESDLVSDTPGHSQNSSTGPGSRAMSHENKAINHALNVYTKNIADYIKNGKDGNAYDSLIVVAEPRMLGNLVSELEKKHLNVLKKVGKELIHMNNSELSKELREDIQSSFPLV